MLEDKSKFSDDDIAQCEEWLEAGNNPNFRAICDVIKDIDKLGISEKHHRLCCECIWKAKKIANKLHEYRMKCE